VSGFHLSSAGTNSSSRTQKPAIDLPPPGLAKEAYNEYKAKALLQRFFF